MAFTGHQAVSYLATVLLVPVVLLTRFVSVVPVVALFSLLVQAATLGWYPKRLRIGGKREFAPRLEPGS